MNKQSTDGIQSRRQGRRRTRRPARSPARSARRRSWNRRTPTRRSSSPTALRLTRLVFPHRSSRSSHTHSDTQMAASSRSLGGSAVPSCYDRTVPQRLLQHSRRRAQALLSVHAHRTTLRRDILQRRRQREGREHGARLHTCLSLRYATPTHPTATRLNAAQPVQNAVQHPISVLYVTPDRFSYDATKCQLLQIHLLFHLINSRAVQHHSLTQHCFRENRNRKVGDAVRRNCVLHFRNLKLVRKDNLLVVVVANHIQRRKLQVRERHSVHILKTALQPLEQFSGLPQLFDPNDRDVCVVLLQVSRGMLGGKAESAVALLVQLHHNVLSAEQAEGVGAEHWGVDGGERDSIGRGYICRKEGLLHSTIRLKTTSKSSAHRPFI